MDTDTSTDSTITYMIERFADNSKIFFKFMLSYMILVALSYTSYILVTDLDHFKGYIFKKLMRGRSFINEGAAELMQQKILIEGLTLRLLNHDTLGFIDDYDKNEALDAINVPSLDVLTDKTNKSPIQIQVIDKSQDFISFVDEYIQKRAYNDLVKDNDISAESYEPVDRHLGEGVAADLIKEIKVPCHGHKMKSDLGQDIGMASTILCDSQRTLSIAIYLIEQYYSMKEKRYERSGAYHTVYLFGLEKAIMRYKLAKLLNIDTTEMIADIQNRFTSEDVIYMKKGYIPPYDDNIVTLMKNYIESIENNKSYAGPPDGYDKYIFGVVKTNLLQVMDSVKRQENADIENKETRRKEGSIGVFIYIVIGLVVLGLIALACWGIIVSSVNSRGRSREEGGVYTPRYFGGFIDKYGDEKIKNVKVKAGKYMIHPNWRNCMTANSELFIHADNIIDDGKSDKATRIKNLIDGACRNESNA